MPLLRLVLAVNLIDVTIHQRRKRVREGVATATMRLAWAKAEAIKRSHSTQALKSFIKASRLELRVLKAELIKLNRAVKQAAALKI